MVEAGWSHMTGQPIRGRDEFLQPRFVGLTMAALAFLSPCGIGIGSGMITLGAMSWQVAIWADWFVVSILGPQVWIESLWATFPMFVFARQMARLYAGRTTIRRALTVGLITAVPFAFIGTMNALPRLWDPMWPYGFNAIPVPIVLLIGWLLIRFYPPPLPQQAWPEVEKHSSA